jgi:hypothetical protein
MIPPTVAGDGSDDVPHVMIITAIHGAGSQRRRPHLVVGNAVRGNDCYVRELAAEFANIFKTHYAEINNHGIGLLPNNHFPDVFSCGRHGNTAKVSMHQGGKRFGDYAVTVSDDDINRLHIAPLLDHIRNRGIANG